MEEVGGLSSKGTSRNRNDRTAELGEEQTGMSKDPLKRETSKNEENGSASRRRKSEEACRKELECKDRRILELEQTMMSLENFLREHTDTVGIGELEAIVDSKGRRIDELEETVAEFEDFLKQNPDVKELHELRRRVNAGDRRIRELERWIEESDDNSAERRKLGIDQARVVELEKMVTQLEDYVREHNVDVLKRKLQDREFRIEQLESRVGSLEKEILLAAERERTDKADALTRGSKDFDKKGTSTEARSNESDDSGIDRSFVNDPNRKARGYEEMENALSEKDKRIRECERELAESNDRTSRMRKKMTALEKELSDYEAEDIGVLKEEIRVRDERIIQLEDEVDSLERAFNEGVDLEQIEELMEIIKRKEERERQYEEDFERNRNRIDELSEALRESVVVASDGERKLKHEEKMKRNALERVAKLEQKMASVQTAVASKCSTCQPLLLKFQRSEKKLQRLTEERTSQLEDLRQMKCEAIKAAVSEKDAHLALLELPGIKSARQANQAKKLKAERMSLLERLKKEDERSIELSMDKRPSNSERTSQLPTGMLETSEDENDEELENEEKKEANEGDRSSRTSSPRPATTNGDSRGHATTTTINASGSDSRQEERANRPENRR